MQAVFDVTLEMFARFTDISISIVPPFPAELLESSESPNIFITSPTASSNPRFPPPLSMNINSHGLHSMHTLSSPNSSPTNSDFPTHLHHSLSRQHSFQHVSFSRSEGAASTPLPPSPGSAVSMDLFDGGDSEPSGRGSAKRQRTSNDSSGGLNGVSGSDSMGSSASAPGPGSSVTGKKLSRARSDSAPLGYGLGGLTTWQHSGGRPRSGSGMSGQRGVPNIGNMTRSNGTPMLSISTVPSNAPTPGR